jgi:hypothetical protein
MAADLMLIRQQVLGRNLCCAAFWPPETAPKGLSRKAHLLGQPVDDPQPFPLLYPLCLKG